MIIKRQNSVAPPLFSILFWGSLWGIFEATVGYGLHLLPVKLGSYIWFPAAYFFMDRAYNATGRQSTVMGVALLSAAIKLVNLLTPIRADYVINPAVSIVLEAMVMAAALWIINGKAGQNQWTVTPWRILFTNTAWRLCYLLYLGVIAPAWIREVSVWQDAAQRLNFLAWENLLSSIVSVLAMGVVMRIGKRMHRASARQYKRSTQYTIAGCLLVASVALQLAL